MTSPLNGTLSADVGPSLVIFDIVMSATSGDFPLTLLLVLTAASIALAFSALTFKLVGTTTFRRAAKLLMLRLCGSRRSYVYTVCDKPPTAPDDGTQSADHEFDYVAM